MNAFQQMLAHQGAEVFETDQEWTGVSTPLLFASGRPALYYAKQTDTHLHLTDSGLNFRMFEECLPDPERAQRAFRYQVSTLHMTDRLQGMALTFSVPAIDAAIGIGDMTNILSRLVSYRPKTAEDQDLEELLIRLEGFLRLRLGREVTRDAKLVGQSGQAHHFDFMAGSTLAEYATPSADHTGRLLRKIADVGANQPETQFMVFLDDREQPKRFNEEAAILNPFCQIAPVGRLLESLTLH